MKNPNIQNDINECGQELEPPLQQRSQEQQQEAPSPPPPPQQQQQDGRGQNRKYVDPEPPLDSSNNLDADDDGNNMANMIDFLVQYRNRSKAGASKLKNLSDGRILSLSYIFLFKFNRESSCTHHLEHTHHINVLDSINIKRHWKPLFDVSQVKQQAQILTINEIGLALCFRFKISMNF
ncbi:unnamed protein product [Absidia cylindrospora]